MCTKASRPWIQLQSAGVGMLDPCRAVEWNFCLRQVVELVVGCHLICSQWVRVNRKIAEPSREPKVQQRGKGGSYTVILSLGHVGVARGL